MVLRSPLGRLLSFLFTLGIAAILYFAVIKDRIDDADTKSSGSDPTQAGDETLFEQANFTKALSALRSKESGGAPMLKVQVLPGQAEFQLKDGEKAHGYRYNAESGKLEPAKVEIVGGGTIEGLQYSLRLVAPDITERLDGAVRERNAELRATTMTLEKGPTGGKLRWTVNAEGGGRTGLVFYARPDGSGLAEPAEYDQRESGRSSGGGSGAGGSAVDKARKQQECIVKAAGDAQKVQECLK